MPNGPCPQAAASPGIAPLVPDPLYFAVEADPILPRAGPVAPEPVIPLVNFTVAWPYHLPAFNGLDCLWWSMLARAAYWTDATWINNVALWSGPILRTAFTSVANPAGQGYALVELTDSVLIVVPGTSSELEALQYVLSHSLQSVATDPTQGWQINSAWQARGFDVWNAYLAWPPPAPTKPVIVIGHSSGGAYGAYVAFKVYQNAGPNTAIVTYGAPIWGTPTMYRTMTEQKKPQVIEFQNAGDPVTVIPPDWSILSQFSIPFTSSQRPTYNRLGNVLIFQGNSRPLPDEGNTITAAAISAMMAIVVRQSLGASHATGTYTDSANDWAGNDPTIVNGQYAGEYNSLLSILGLMNTAGV